MTVYFAAVALAAVSITACGSSQKKDEASKRPATEVYSGILPAADAYGIKYNLKLDYANDSTFTSGRFDLEETSLAADSLKSDGYREMDTEKYKGDFTIISGKGVNAAKSYVKLMPETKGDTLTAPAPIYFLVASDSTLTMVNSELEVSVNPDLNYTLKLK